jgi:hypothetical protein
MLDVDGLPVMKPLELAHAEILEAVARRYGKSVAWAERQPVWLLGHIALLNMAAPHGE